MTTHTTHVHPHLHAPALVVTLPMLVLMVLLSVAGVLVIAAPADARPGSILVWNTFRGPGDDFYFDIALAPGGVYAVGTTQGADDDVLISKNSAANRNMGWRSWDGGGTKDTEFGMVVDRDGNVIVAGVTRGSGDSDVFVIKADARGNPMWEKVLDFAGGDDGAFGVACDPQGYIYVAGYRTANAQMGWWIMKLFPDDGGVLWESFYDAASGYTRPSALCVDASRTIYVTGESFNTLADQGARGRSDIVTIAFDTWGNRLWEVRSDGPLHASEVPRLITLGTSGALYVGATSYNQPIGGNDLIVVRLQTTGTQVWLRGQDDSLGWNDQANALRVGPSNSVYMAATATRPDQAKSRGIVARWNSAGALLWKREWTNGGRSARFYDVVVDGRGTSWAAGEMRSPHRGNDLEAVIVKHAANGRGIWASAWEGPGRRDDSFAALTLQGSKYLFAAGWSEFPNRGTDAAIVKYER